MWTIYDLIMVPIGIILVIGVAVGLYYWLRNKSNTIRRIPFMVVGVILCGLELAKQIYGFYSTDGYSTFWLPFHLCSIYFLFALPFAAFTKQENKAGRMFWAITLFGSLEVFAVMLLAPYGLIMGKNEIVLTGGSAEELFFAWHSVLFHLFAIAPIIFAIALRPVKLKLMDFVWGLVIFAGFMLFVWHTSNAIRPVNSIGNLGYASFGLMGLFPDGGLLVLFFQFLTWVIHILIVVACSAAVLYGPRLYEIVKCKIGNNKK
jgi:hypothetical protein